MYTVHETAMDVRVIVPYYSGTIIQIEGLVAPYICTVNVLGARNVALNQRVSQSSNYSGDPLYKVRAENAIDGNRGPDYDSGTCSRTEFETGTTPYWNITLDREYWLNIVFLYNSNANMEWLSGFRITAYNQQGPTGTTYIDDSPTPLSVYKANVNANGPFSAIRIQAYRVLMLCEVEIYADAACPENIYGLECQLQCQCQDNQGCSPLVGTCIHTPFFWCPPGTHGEVCELSCSKNCHNNLCDAHSGACLGCVPGYQGEFCDQVCDLGTYGPNCSLTCLERCSEPCNHINGSCPCIDGFDGDLCTDYKPGLFGENCTNRCPRPCRSNLCDKITGLCFSCVGNQTGSKCEECKVGWFGENCTSTCPRLCRSNLCDRTTGRCLSCSGKRAGPKCVECKPGWFGENCTRTCPALCRSNLCNKITGQCLSCVGRQKGPRCEDCKPGWFGNNCTRSCPRRCRSSLCDQITGHCLSCVWRRTGPKCEECQTGFFGENCTSTCPRICPPDQCDKITGQCLTCLGRRMGPRCEDCPPHYYGALCDIPCTVYCRNKSCNKVDGICHSCVDGFRGEYCRIEIEDVYPPVWMLPLIVPFVILVLCCCVMGGGSTEAEEDGSVDSMVLF